MKFPWNAYIYYQSMQPMSESYRLKPFAVSLSLLVLPVTTRARSSAYLMNLRPLGSFNLNFMLYRMFHNVGPMTEPCGTSSLMVISCIYTDHVCDVFSHTYWYAIEHSFNCCPSFILFYGFQYLSILSIVIRV